MSNLQNVDTQKNVERNVNDFKTFLESEGLKFGKKLERSKKTKQQKLVDSISKEIKIMSKRSDLNLLFVGKVYPFFLFLNKTFLAELIKFLINLLHFQQLVRLLNIFQNKQK